LDSRPEHVRLHFQAGPGERWTSPQAIADEQQIATAKANAVESVAADAALLAELQSCLSLAVLLAHTPSEMLPSVVPDVLAMSEPEVEQQLAAAPVLSNYGGPVPSREYPSQQAEPPPEAYSQAARPAKGAQQGEADRSQNDLVQRNRALQVYAQQQVRGQRLNTIVEAPPAPQMSEGASRAFWIGDKLLLARRVQMGEETVVQGCWLDWPSIEGRLSESAADLLPQFSLAPVHSESELHPARALATLPVQVEVPPVVAAERGWSPLRLSLAIAWSCLVLASLAMGALLWGVVSLSERRAAFVAAVTHELRTPLTTFRMYSEMLAQGMTPPDSRQQYLETLERESVRLSHLVENVLSYARLERGNGLVRRSPAPLAELVESWKPQLAERAAQADLELTATIDEQAATALVSTDPQAVGQILFNLVDNAAKYANGSRQRRIEISCSVFGKTAAIRVRDFGPGFSAAQRRKLFRPFSKTVQEAAVTAPGVGLGLALCRRLARDLGAA
jgi:signal transduction histidine kinase